MNNMHSHALRHSISDGNLFNNQGWSSLSPSPPPPNPQCAGGCLCTLKEFTACWLLPGQWACRGYRARVSRKKNYWAYTESHPSSLCPFGKPFCLSTVFCIPSEVNEQKKLIEQVGFMCILAHGMGMHPLHQQHYGACSRSLTTW